MTNTAVEVTPFEMASWTPQQRFAHNAAHNERERLKSLPPQRLDRADRLGGSMAVNEYERSLLNKKAPHSGGDQMTDEKWFHLSLAEKIAWQTAQRR